MFCLLLPHLLFAWQKKGQKQRLINGRGCRFDSLSHTRINAYEQVTYERGLIEEIKKKKEKFIIKFKLKIVYLSMSLLNKVYFQYVFKTLLFS